MVVPRLSTNGLKWQCTGDFVARQCLQYRGVLPVCADPSLGSPDGAILKAALQEVGTRGHRPPPTGQVAVHVLFAPLSNCQLLAQQLHSKLTCWAISELCGERSVAS